MSNDPISLNPSAIARVLGTVALLLILASFAGQLMRFLLGDEHIRGVSLFSVDQELSIPTFFTVLLLLITTLLLGVITALHRQRKAPHVSKWAILTFGFLYMAFDEAFQVHERLLEPLRALLGGGTLGIFYFAWVIPGIVIVGIVGIFFLRFLLHLPTTTRRTFLIAATLYVGGAIGIELIGGRYAEVHGFRTLAYNLIATAEESLEMAGVIVFIWALLTYIADTHQEVQFRFERARGKITNS